VAAADHADVLLFRFSALTFNSHRIHYDRRWAMEVEGYPDLVVHGPLTSTLLLDFARDSNPGRDVRAYATQARAPLFADAPFELRPTRAGRPRRELWAVTPRYGGDTRGPSRVTDYSIETSYDADEQLELRMDPNALYREETYTDRRIGIIRVMTPVKTDGSIDLGRKILYVGEAQLLSPVGALPITFEIDATSLGDAAEKFADGAKIGVERAIRELQELRREQSSNIVIPDRMPPDIGGRGGPRGPGRIQL
jgi:hypothetical protein